jgi:hypothetical protein
MHTGNIRMDWHYFPYSRKILNMTAMVEVFREIFNQCYLLSSLCTSIRMEWSDERFICIFLGPIPLSFFFFLLFFFFFFFFWTLSICYYVNSLSCYIGQLKSLIQFLKKPFIEFLKCLQLFCLL